MAKKPRSLKSMLMSAIGRVWMFYGPRLAVKRRCKNPARTGWFKCEKCGTDIQKVEVDHVIPSVLPEEGFIGWDRYLAGKFVQEKDLMGLCHECHAKKTREESAERKKYRVIKKAGNGGALRA